MNQSFDSQEQLKAKLKNISDDFFDLNSTNQKNLSKFSVDERNAKEKVQKKSKVYTGMHFKLIEIE